MPPFAPRHLLVACLALIVTAGAPSQAEHRAAPSQATHDPATAATRPSLFLPRIERAAVRWRQVIGPAGGVIAIEAGDLAGVRVEVPAGALTAPTLIWVQAGTAVRVPQSRPVGAAVDIGPRGVLFTQPVRVTLPFDPGLVPPGAPVSALSVARGTPDGSGLRLPPVAQGLGTVAVDVATLATFQVHASLDVPVECPAAAPPPSCTTLTAPSPDDAPADLLVDSCLVVPSGSYVYRYVNIVDGGTLYFQDDGGTIDFRVASLLVEQGGTLQAGAWCQPFGSQGGTLDIGLWGTDPTNQGATPTTGQGIVCQGPGGNGQCYPSTLTTNNHYCTGSDPSDPCASTTADSNGANALFQGYGNLPFDDNPFGFKTLAVSYGGSLRLFGQRGVAPADRSDAAQRLASCPVPAAAEQHDPAAWAALTGQGWVRLDADATAGTTTLTLDRPVDWQVGDEIVVGTTDWHVGHTEIATVQANDGLGTLTLTSPLAYAHHGSLYTVPAALGRAADNPNGSVETRGVVALLNRSITVRSLGATADQPFPAAAACGQDANNPDCYFGGHVLARQGFGQFQVQGVEFRQLGQGGRMGHYPVHFHMAKSTDYTNAFVKDSSVWASNTRFIVAHATHDVTMARNVGYLSVGHGYYLEDGSEIDNLMCQNLAVSTQGALQEYFAAQPTDSPTHRYVPPILANLANPAINGSGQQQVSGSDSFMPVAFWTMNLWNELVGNQAVGVGGYGSCYWLLGSGVSGASASYLTWASGTNSPQDYADFNLMGGRQAPVKRFRGNGCHSSAYALQTTMYTDPQYPDDAGYTGVPQPPGYVMMNSDLPMVQGNYQPTLYTPGGNCAQAMPSNMPVDQRWGGNVAGCSGPVIDRFTTSFNWAQVNFGAIWLRPWWYAFVNGAVTDQLFGGLGFVSGGSWGQVPPGYYTVTRNGVFVGSTRAMDDADAGPRGPALTNASCVTPIYDTCVLPPDGTGVFQSNVQPKRMITIYDGPFYAEGNVFTNTPTWDCDPTSYASCGVYLTTLQPQSQTTPGHMTVQDAAIGWKQPNGFYYPPAFALKRSAFDASTNRHYVLDPDATYLQGNRNTPNGPTTYKPLFMANPDVTPIDFSTILLDLDGTLTGMEVSPTEPETTSVSRNEFFAAPSQVDECLSFGVQTSPYGQVTTVMAPLTGAPSASGTSVNSGAWGGGVFPAVPIYRQLTMPGEAPCGDSVCGAGFTWGCGRAALMAGGQTGQSPYLTTNNGLYYIDTNTSGSQSLSCLRAGGFHLATFTPGQSYVVYQLFARPGTKVTYQLYVGSSYDPTAGGAWVRVAPHVYTGGGNDMQVTLSPAPTGSTSFNATTGVLTITLDNGPVAGEYAFTSREADETCLPRDMCQLSPDGQGCVVSDSLSEAELKDDIDAVCRYWGSATGGESSLSGAAPDLSLVDCPSGGCIGYAITLPGDFSPQPYSVVGQPLVQCYPDNGTWNRPLTTIDPACEAAPAPSGFCGS